MVSGIVSRELSSVTEESAKTFGEEIYARYGITGARGEAESGFPSVINCGLPRLEEALSNGLDFNHAGCCVLLHLIAAQDDTNLIHRGGRGQQLEIRQQLSAMLADDPFPATETLLRLDQDFIEKNLSPGGSADLLSLTYFLYFLK